MEVCNISIYCGDISKVSVDALVLSQEKLNAYKNSAAKSLVSTNGPTKETPIRLTKIYKSILEMAIVKGWRTVAFEQMSTNEGYPKLGAAEVGIRTVYQFLKKNKKYVDRVIFTSSDKFETGIYKKVLRKYLKFEH